MSHPALRATFPTRWGSGSRLARMQDLGRMMRLAGIVAGILFLISFVWVVLLGPAALMLLTPRS